MDTSKTQFKQRELFKFKNGDIAWAADEEQSPTAYRITYKCREGDGYNGYDSKGKSIHTCNLQLHHNKKEAVEFYITVMKKEIESHMKASKSCSDYIKYLKGDLRAYPK